MKANLAYGRTKLTVQVPGNSLVLSPASIPPVHDAADAIRKALASPVQCPSLASLARKKSGGNACLVVSDITRPVPYQVLLPPLLETLEQNGIARKDILILIATGMHRASTKAERIEMFGPEVCQRYRIVDHDATDNSTLVVLPRRTSRGTCVSVDRAYLQADLKIATGLVEPHFMAGYSGGRKAICPGLVNLATVQKFHGPEFLENPCAATGVLEGNPCHQESTDVAHLAGVDFLLNVAMNLDRQIVGVFAGDLDAAFAEAVRCVDSFCRVNVEEEADIVVTSGGGYPLDKTLYQAVKGMVGALPVVREGGCILMAAECSEGIGSAEYRALMRQYSGCHKQFLSEIMASPTVKKDQWELEMQCKVLAKVGVQGLLLVTRGISPEELPWMSLTSGYELSNAEDPARMVEDALEMLLARASGSASESPRVVVIPEGPYVLAECASPVPA